MRTPDEIETAARVMAERITSLPIGYWPKAEREAFWREQAAAVLAAVDTNDTIQPGFAAGDVTFPLTEWPDEYRTDPKTMERYRWRRVGPWHEGTPE